MNLNEHRKSYRPVLTGAIVISFMGFALVNTLGLIHFREIPFYPDMCFHWQRITELMNSRRFFPYFAMNSFKDSGSAVLTMYPYLFLYPFVIIFKIVKSITVTTEWILGLSTLLAMLIAYFSSLSFSRSRRTSYLFAVLYGLSFSLFLNVVNSYAFGMNMAFIFMPLVIFGYVDLLKDHRWLMLAVGMTCLIYSEVLITTFVIGLLTLWTVINFVWLNWRTIVSLCKAALLTLLLSALFWLPATYIYLTNTIAPIGKKQINGVDLSQSLRTAFDIKLMTGGNNIILMTIGSALGLLAGLVSCVYGKRYRRQMYLIAILVLLFISSWFPWARFDGTPLTTVQFPWRFYLVPQVILTYLLAEVVVRGLQRAVTTPLYVKAGISVLIVLGLVFQLAGQYHYFKVLPGNKPGTTQQLNDRPGLHGH